MAMGGCNLRGPLSKVHRVGRRAPGSDWSGVPSNFRVVGPPFWTYTFGEFFQAIRLYRGECDIPDEIKFMCGVDRNFKPNPDILAKETDIYLFEPNTSQEISLDGYYLNRVPIVKMLDVFRTLGREPGKLAGLWYSRGINGFDDEYVKTVANELAPVLRDSDLSEADKELYLTTLREARGSLRDVRKGLGQLLSMIDKPAGIVTYTWQYMEDGRHISWPATFNKQLLAAAEEVSIPVFEPYKYVVERGAKAAMRDDMRHYNGEFDPVMAGKLVGFLQSVAGYKPADTTETVAMPAVNAPSTVLARPLSYVKLAPPFDLYLGRPPQYVLSAPSMMNAYERAFLYQTAKDYYSGDGIILDGGIFMGASTCAFGYGVGECDVRSSVISHFTKPIVSIDQAIASVPMVERFKREGAEGIKPGDSFAHIIRKNIEPVSELVDLRIGDITKIGLVNQDIEILFLDVLKSRNLSLFAIENYFPRLIPGRSLVIQQDYFIDGLVYVRIHQECLADKFEFIGEIGSTAIFRCKEKITEDEAKEVAVKCKSLDQQCAYLDAATQRSADPQRRLLMMISVVRLLGYSRKMDEARARLEKVDEFIAEIGEDKLLPRVQSSLRGARHICASDGSRESLAQAHEIAYGASR